MSGRHHRRQILRNVDAIFFAALVDSGEMVEDLSGGDVRRQVEIDIADAPFQHFLVDAAGYYITRGQILPFRRVVAA